MLKYKIILPVMAKINIFLAYIFERVIKCIAVYFLLIKTHDSGKNQLIYSIYI